MEERVETRSDGLGDEQEWEMKKKSGNRSRHTMNKDVYLYGQRVFSLFSFGFGMQARRKKDSRKA